MLLTEQEQGYKAESLSLTNLFHAYLLLLLASTNSTLHTKACAIDNVIALIQRHMKQDNVTLRSSLVVEKYTVNTSKTKNVKVILCPKNHCFLEGSQELPVCSSGKGKRTWMIVYGAMVEWYWQEKTEVLEAKHYTIWVVDGWMSMEQWWNDTDRGNWSAGR